RDPRRVPVAAFARVRAGGARARAFAHRHRVSRDPAQCAGTVDRAGEPDGRQRDSARERPFVSRSRRSKPDVMGLHDWRRAQRDPAGVVDERVPWACHLSYGAGAEPDRRGPGRRAQSASDAPAMSLLSVEDLTIALPPGVDRAQAISNVSFALDPGEVLCIVGESGSGKSVTAAAIMGLLPRTLRGERGRILFEGRDLLALPDHAMRALRGAHLGMIFQEPMTALNPLMRVGDQVAEVLTVHGARDAKGRVPELLAAVNLPDPVRLARVYPHLLSGGQRQRVMIAIALALEPTLLIADEPTTALDVTT